MAADGAGDAAGAAAGDGPRLRVELLGVLAVRPGQPPAGPRLRALLVRLALAGGRVVDVGDLVGQLWEGAPPADEVGALQSLVSRLRRALGDPEAVQQLGSGYRLAVRPEDVDVLRVERALEQGRAALRRGEAEAALRLLAPVVEQLRARPVPEVPPAVATRLAEAGHAAVTGAAEAELALGRPPAELADLQSLVDDRPLDERAGGLLVRALAAAGRPDQALAVYERLRRGLADELGLDPSPALQQVQRDLLSREPEPGAAPGPVAVPAPVRSWWTSFVGRDADLERVLRLLQAGRLVTVLGPGGAGKTRLAAEAAPKAAAELGTDVCVVELAPVTDPADVPQAVLSALGRREAPVLDRRAGRSSLAGTDLLLEVLAGRSTLLVLDNCEHLLDAVAQLGDLLLGRCPGLRVLATSREPLGIDGEALAVLGPLPVPDADADVAAAQESPAVRLLVDRAAAVSPGFVLDASNVRDVVEVVRRLDGLPLAVELAAARLRTLPVHEVADRLSDRFRLLTGGSRTALPRHRTLHAVVAWSWDLLTPAERLLAERLSVLAGTAAPGTTAEVCGDALLPAADVPELMAALVDRSLLQRVDGSAPRYRVLETIREFGLGRLADRGELAALRSRHAAVYARLATRQDARLRTGEQVAALDELRADHDDLVLALRTLCDTGRVDDALGLALDLTWYFQLLGREAESAAALGAALALPGGDPALRASAEAFCALIAVTSLQGGTEPAAEARPRLVALAEQLLQHETSRPMVALAAPLVLFLAGRAEASRRELDRLCASDDAWLVAAARLFRAQLAENSGRLDDVRRDAEAALATFRAVPDRWGIATCLPLLATARQLQGDLDGALAALEEAERCLRELGQLDVVEQVFLAVRMSDLHLRRGDVAAATAAEAAGRRVALRSGSREMTAILTALGGGLCRAVGDLAGARERQREADAVMGQVPLAAVGLDHGVSVVEAQGAALDLAEGDAAAAEVRLRRAYAAATSSEDLPMAAFVGVTVTALQVALGRFVEAAEGLGAAARLRGGDDPTALDVREVTARCREALGDEAFDAAYARGRALDTGGALARLDPARSGVPVA